MSKMTSESMEEIEDDVDDSLEPKRRRRRWRMLVRFSVVGTLIVALLVATGGWLVTRSWFIISQLTPEMERKLGGEVTIGTAAYQGDGRVIFTDMRLRVPGMEGLAGEIATINRAIVRVDLHGLLSGGIRVMDVEVDDATLRLSESEKGNGKLNVLELNPDWSGDGKGPSTPPPRVRIRRAALEFGSHHGSEYEMLGRRLVSGDMYASTGQEGWYNFELAEVNENGVGIGPGGIFIKGNWNPASNEHHCRVDGIELDDRVFRMCPQAARVWWKRMELEGKVDAVIFSWHPDRPFSVEFAVSNVGLTLPIDEAGNLWARYHEGEVQPTASRPRMRVKTGIIRVSNDSIALQKMTGHLASTDAASEVAGVPFNINFAMSSLPPLDWDSREQWMEQVIRTAPFELQFRMDQFSLTRNEAGEAPALDLPVIVAKVLAKFQMTDWVMSTSLEMSRGMPTADERGTIIAAKPVTNGQAYIHKASGKYQKFPYQLNDVEAYMQFDNDKVLVHYLNGKGSGNAQFRITGVIAPPENDASVLLRISGANVPLDDRLREAFRDGERQAFDMLFDRETCAALQQHNLLPSEQTIEAAQQRAKRIGDQIAELRNADSGSDAQAQEQLAALHRDQLRVQRYIDAGPFALGGAVDVDLKIERALGPKQPTTTTGTLRILSAGAVYEKFPYPLRVTSGTLELHNDRIAIQQGQSGDGLAFVTPGGGRGSITGELLFPKIEGERKVQPNFVVTVGDDELNENVYAAIPMSKSQQSELAPGETWPGGAFAKAADLVRSIGLAGTCDYAGVIDTNDQGKIGFEFDVSMRDGEASPSAQLANMFGFASEPWPHNFALGQVRGKLNVTRDAVKWIDVTGVHRDSTIVANGIVDYSGEETSTRSTVHFERIPVELHVLHAAPPEQAINLAKLWTRFQPQGVFDADFSYGSGMNGQPDMMDLTIQPRDMSVMLYGKRIGLTHEGGTFRIGNQSVELHDFAMRMTSAEQRDDGMLRLNGGRKRGADGWSIQGAWNGARFESPLILEVLHSSDRDLAKGFRELRAAGAFDSQFTVSSDPSAGFDYSIAIQPRNIEARWNGTNLQSEVRQGSLTAVPGELHLTDLSGTVAGGEYKVDGVIQTRDPIDTKLNITYQGAVRTNHVRAFLPKVAADALAGIDFKDVNSSSTVSLSVNMSQMPGYVGQWKSSVDGTMTTNGASFEAGVPFSDVHGDFAIQASYEPGVTPQFSMDAHVKRATALGQSLTNLRAPLALEDDGKVIRMPWLIGDAELGTVTAQASVGVSENREYETLIELVGVPLAGFQPAQSASELESADTKTDTKTEAKTDAKPEPPPAKGDVYASLSMAGRLGDAASKRGRGTIRVLNGNMANVPLVLKLMQVVQLTLPVGGVLDYAEAEAYLVGDRMMFERILFESTAGQLAMLQLFGEGEMNFQTLELNTRFRVRSGVRGVRDVIGVISDKLYEIEVTGTLRNPQPRLVPLPGRK